MSSQLEDIQNKDARYYGAQKGTVVDNADPQGLHRCRIRVAGIADPYTDWSLPLTSGGGSAQRGGHIVPAVGADVVVWFHQGDPQGDSWYACGNWGQPEDADVPEVPDDVNADLANAHLVHSLQLGPVTLTFDERPDKLKIVVAEKTAGDFFIWDFLQQTIQIRLSCSFLLDAPEVTITGAQISFNKRVVRADSTTI